MEASAAPFDEHARVGLATPIQRFAAWMLDAFIAAVAFTPLNPILHSEQPSPTLFFALWSVAMLLLFAYLVAFDGGPRGRHRVNG